MTLLQINTSLFSNAGQSSRLADRFVAGFRGAHPDVRVVVRDLAREPIPHLTAERFQAFLAEPHARSAEQQAIVAASDALIGELQAADVIVIGLPMYNFGVPSQLKAYFDHVARAGSTFRYTEGGPVGLLTGKKAYVFATRGGLYAGTARHATARARTCVSSWRFSASPTSSSCTPRASLSATRAGRRRLRRRPAQSRGSPGKNASRRERRAFSERRARRPCRTGRPRDSRVARRRSVRHAAHPPRSSAATSRDA